MSAGLAAANPLGLIGGQFTGAGQLLGDRVQVRGVGKGRETLAQFSRPVQLEDRRHPHGFLVIPAKAGKRPKFWFIPPPEKDQGPGVICALGLLQNLTQASQWAKGGLQA